MSFSRLSLVTFGTAAALVASSLTTPASATEQPATTTIIQVAEDTSTKETSSGSSDIDLDDIAEYVALITGIVSILSAALALGTAMDRAAR